MNDPILAILADYGWAIVLLYVGIKEFVPLLKKWLPAEVKRRQAKDREEARQKSEFRRYDDELRKRQTIAMENIAKSLVILQNNQGRQIDLLNQVAAGISQANTGIAVLIDRELRMDIKQSGK